MPKRPHDVGRRLFLEQLEPRQLLAANPLMQQELLGSWSLGQMDGSNYVSEGDVDWLDGKNEWSVRLVFTASEHDVTDENEGHAIFAKWRTDGMMRGINFDVYQANLRIVVGLDVNEHTTIKVPIEANNRYDVVVRKTLTTVDVFVEGDLVVSVANDKVQQGNDESLMVGAFTANGMTRGKFGGEIHNVWLNGKAWSDDELRAMYSDEVLEEEPDQSGTEQQRSTELIVDVQGPIGLAEKHPHFFTDWLSATPENPIIIRAQGAFENPDMAYLSIIIAESVDIDDRNRVSPAIYASVGRDGNGSIYQFFGIDDNEKARVTFDELPLGASIDIEVTYDGSTVTLAATHKGEVVTELSFSPPYSYDSFKLGASNQQWDTSSVNVILNQYRVERVVAEPESSPIDPSVVQFDSQFVTSTKHFPYGVEIHSSNDYLMFSTDEFPAGYDVLTTQQPARPWFYDRKIPIGAGTTLLPMREYGESYLFFYHARTDTYLETGLKYTRSGSPTEDRSMSGSQGVFDFALPPNMEQIDVPLTIAIPQGKELDQLWGLQWIAAAKREMADVMGPFLIKTPTFSFWPTDGSLSLDYADFPSGFQVSATSDGTTKPTVIDIPRGDGTLPIKLKGSGTFTLSIIDHETEQVIGRSMTVQVSDGAASELTHWEELVLHDLAYVDETLPQLLLSPERAEELVDQANGGIAAHMSTALPTKGTMRAIASAYAKREVELAQWGEQLAHVRQALLGVEIDSEVREALHAGLAFHANLTAALAADYDRVLRIANGDISSVDTSDIIIPNNLDIAESTSGNLSSATITTDLLGGEIKLLGTDGRTRQVKDHAFSIVGESQVPVEEAVTVTPTASLSFARWDKVRLHLQNVPSGTKVEAQFLTNRWATADRQTVANSDQVLDFAISLFHLRWRIAIYNRAGEQIHSIPINIQDRRLSINQGGVHGITALAYETSNIVESTVEPIPGESNVILTGGSGAAFDLSTVASVVTNVSFNLASIGAVDDVVVQAFDGEASIYRGSTLGGNVSINGENITGVIIHAPAMKTYESGHADFARLAISDVSVTADRAALKEDVPTLLPVHNAAMAALAQRAWKPEDLAEGTPPTCWLLTTSPNGSPVLASRITTQPGATQRRTEPTH